MRLFTALFDYLQTALPSSCLSCHRLERTAVCHDCIETFAKPQLRCSTCALPLPSMGESEIKRCGSCLSLGSTLDACTAVVDYAYPWNTLIARLKYSDGGDLKAQPALAKCMAQVSIYAATQDVRLQQALQIATQSNWIVPVPLHPERQKERGFNQAFEFAKALFHSDLSTRDRIRTDLLLRIKATKNQADLPRDERHSNLKSAFAAAPLNAEQLKGKHVLLIDDVSTTGATLSSAASALRNAGARTISALIFARTGI